MATIRFPLPLTLTAILVASVTGTLGAQRAAAPSTPLATAPSAAELTLFRLEDDWTRALVRRDAAGFRRLVHPRWVYSAEHGVMGRDEAITEFTTGRDTVTAASNEEMRAHLFGDVAVVTGILVTSGRGATGPFAHRYRYTDTWLLRNGRWQAIASQDYDMPATPPAPSVTKP
ncbi:MAG: hypothetical protein NVS1B4_26240 [Gemmatimonadaceae bacterium]